MVAATLIMGAGWGIRGAFGHSRGAMMPGAMLGATLAVCAMRPDWWWRAAIICFACSIGWGFGGQSSYGLIIGYSNGGTLLNSMWGYGSLWLVGGLYGGIGAGILALVLTKPRSFLDQFVWPLVFMYAAWLAVRHLVELEPYFEWLLGNGEATADAWWHHLDFLRQSILYYEGGEAAQGSIFWLHDTLWLCVAVTLVLNSILWAAVPKWRNANALIVLLAAGWLAGMFILIKLAGVRMNPDRAESWAGVLGVQLALVGYFLYHRNWAGFMLCCYGFIAGAYGFSMADFVQTLGNAKWGPIGEYAWLREFGFWTVMEQLFGCLMGFGTAIALVRFNRRGLAPAADDSPRRGIDVLSLLFVFGILMIVNFAKAYSGWLKIENMKMVLLTFPIQNWAVPAAIFYLGVLLFVLLRLRRGKLAMAPTSPFGRAQLQAFLIAILVLNMYLLLARPSWTNLLTFVLAIAIGLLIIFTREEKPVDLTTMTTPPESFRWFPGPLHWILWILSPALIWGMATISIGFDLKRYEIRFPEEVEEPAETEEQETRLQLQHHTRSGTMVGELQG